MSKRFNVKCKVGKRSFSNIVFAPTVDSVVTFFNKHFVAKIVSIEETVYEASDSTVYPIDDVDTYKGTMNFLVGNNDKNKINRFVFQTVKNTSTVNEVFDDMKTLLDLDKTTSIKSLVSVNISSK